VVGQAQTPQALSAASYVARGVDLYKKGELDRAMADLNIALTFDARCDQAYVLRGLVKKDRGDLSGALGDFERADGALCGSAAVCADLANGCLSGQPVVHWNLYCRRPAENAGPRYTVLFSKEQSACHRRRPRFSLTGLEQEKSRLREYFEIELGLLRGSIGESLLH
jgi:tetratricopeptide (TPR) repeat protein